MIINNPRRSGILFVFPALLLVAATMLCKAQTALIPGDNSFDKKWLKRGKYEMACFSLDGGRNKREISSLVIEINSGSGPLSIYTTLKLPGSNEQWKETSIVDGSTFKPVYRSSLNSNRELVLKYTKEITCHHYDKQTKKRNKFLDSCRVGVSIYPFLLQPREPDVTSSSIPSSPALTREERERKRKEEEEEEQRQAEKRRIEREHRRMVRKHGAVAWSAVVFVFTCLTERIGSCLAT